MEVWQGLPVGPHPEERFIPAAAVYDLDPDDVLPAALVAVRALVEDALLTLD